MYADKDLAIPDTWNETGPALIANSQEVRLRSFSTSVHKVDTMVAYKNVTDWTMLENTEAKHCTTNFILKIALTIIQNCSDVYPPVNRGLKVLTNNSQYSS